MTGIEIAIMVSAAAYVATALYAMTGR